MAKKTGSKGPGTGDPGLKEVGKKKQRGSTEPVADLHIGQEITWQNPWLDTLSRGRVISSDDEIVCVEWSGSPHFIGRDSVIL